MAVLGTAQRRIERSRTRDVLTLRAVSAPPTLFAGVDWVPVPPVTAVVLPDDAMLTFEIDSEREVCFVVWEQYEDGGEVNEQIYV